MRNSNNNNNGPNNNARGNRRETRSQTNNRSSTNNNDSNTNNDQRGNQFDRRKQQGQQQQPNQQQQQQRQQQPPVYYNQQQQQPYNQSQDRRDRSGQRDQSGHRDRSNQRPGQYGDGGFNRDPYGSSGNLGAIKFTPGYPTRELPPIETKADPTKKFTGRCRLFVGNLPHNTSEEQVRKLFEPFGEIGELFLGPKSSFAFVKMDTKQHAEAARDALDCSNFDGRSLRVRLAAHAAAIRVKNLSPVVTNELLAYSFRYFGEIERAVVVVDDKGKSIGEGIVEYSRKQSALYAIKRCQQESFMLTAAPLPVIVEAYDQHDEEEGLPEKSVNKNSIEYKEQRDVGPRFAEQGTFEHSFGLRWKELFSVEKQKRERLEQEIEETRKSLQDQFETFRVDHQKKELENQLKQLEDNRLKLQQRREQTMTVAQQRDEQRRQQDLLIRQQEEEILRRQQLGESHYLNQQVTDMRAQAQVYQDMLNGADASAMHGTDMSDVNQQNLQQVGMSHEMDTGVAVNPMVSQAPRTFADAAMMGMTHQYVQLQTQMGIAPTTQAAQAMYAPYIPPPPIQSASGDAVGADNFTFQQTYVAPPPMDMNNTNVGGGRQQKMTRSFVNSNNNINVVGRPKKRGRY